MAAWKVLAMIARAAAAATLPLALAGCVTTPGCHWRLVVEPRATASVVLGGDLKPGASLTARPLCLAPRTGRTDQTGGER